MKFKKRILLFLLLTPQQCVYSMEQAQDPLEAIDAQLKILAQDSNIEQAIVELSKTKNLAATDQGGRTRLHYAAFLTKFNALSVVTAIVQQDPHLANQQDTLGETPLHCALSMVPQDDCESSYLFDVCSKLIEHGADPQLKTIQHESAYDYAHKITGAPLLLTLLDDAQLARIDKKLLISRRHVPSLRALITNKHITACDEQGKTRLHHAAELKDISLTELLLQHKESKALVNMQDSTQAAALHTWLSLIPYEDFESRAMLNACTRLLEHGADPLLGNNLGENAIHSLLKNNTLQGFYLKVKPKLLELFLEHATSLDAQTIYGETALHKLLWSVPFSGSMLPLLHTLLNKGANPNQDTSTEDSDGEDEKPWHGSTPLHYLVERCDFRETIIAEQLEAAETLIAYGANVNAQNHNQETPLYLACKAHDQETQDISANRLRFIELLLKSGADANAANTLGVTPLYALVSSDYSEEKARAAQCMLTYFQANPNLTTKAGFTCLHGAVAAYQVDWVTFLLKEPQIDVHKKHAPRLARAQLDDGKTALDMATDMVLFAIPTRLSTIKTIRGKEGAADRPGVKLSMDNFEIAKQNKKWEKTDKSHAGNKIFVALLAKVMEEPL